MVGITNFVGISLSENTDPQESEKENLIVLNGANEWNIAVRDHTPQQMEIFDETVFRHPYELSVVKGADTFTLIAPKIDAVTNHVLELLILEGKFKAIQALTILPTSSKIVFTREEVKPGEKFLIATGEGPEVRKKIQYHTFNHVLDYKHLITSLVEKTVTI